MLLVELNNEGLVDEVATNSGWKAVKEFREYYKSKGIKGFTVVALASDYLTVFHTYNETDRISRAIDEVYGKRNAINTEDPLFLAAIQKYKDIQFNSDLEQERINNEIKARLLRKISEANAVEDDSEISRLSNQLSKHEENIQKFNNRFNKKEAVKTAITSSGYELSRIENDIKSRKNSKFLDNGETFENPNKLGLQEF